MASTPSVLVGSPLSADEVRTELPVVQATFLTRQMSQSANVAERETETATEEEKEEADEECRKEKAKEEEKEREKSHDDGANWIMSSFGCSPTAGGCCPINTNGDTDIFGRKFSLPVSTEQPRRQHNAHTLLVLRPRAPPCTDRRRAQGHGDQYLFCRKAAHARFPHVVVHLLLRVREHLRSGATGCVHEKHEEGALRR